MYVRSPFFLLAYLGSFAFLCVYVLLLELLLEFSRANCTYLGLRRLAWAFVGASWPFWGCVGVFFVLQMLAKLAF